MTSKKSSSRIGTAFIAAVGTFAVAALLAACQADTAAETDAVPRANIAAVIKGLDNPYFQEMKRGLDDGAAELHVQSSVQAAAEINDTEGQAARLTAVSKQNFTCYVVNPTNGTNLLKPIAEITAAKKTVINIDQPVEPGPASAMDAIPTSYIGTDNSEIGKRAADAMKASLPAGGKVAIIGGELGDVTSIERVDGFINNLGPSLRVTDNVNAGWNRQTAMEKAAEIFADQPDLVGMFVANDDMALGASKALSDAGKTIGDVKLISVDGNAEALAAISGESLTATVAQYPYVIGRLAVQACQSAALGKSLPTKVNSPIDVVTIYNVSRAKDAEPEPFNNWNNPLDHLG